MMPHVVPDNRRLLKEWPLNMIIEVQLRRYIMRRSALEIFMLDGSVVLLNFPEKLNGGGGGGGRESDNEEVA